MRYALLFLAIGYLMVGSSTADEKTAKKDLDALQGVWKVEGLTQDGKQATAAQLKEMTFTIKDNKYTVMVGGKEAESGTIKLDPDKKPKTIDFSIQTGNDKGKSQQGIYELNGDNLKFCMSAPGKADRPIKLAAAANSGHILTTLKRAR